MTYLFMALAALLIVAADQLSKLWVVHNIAPAAANVDLPGLASAFGTTAEHIAAQPRSIDGIPYIFDLSHHHNYGAAFSSFEGMRWLFVVIFLAFGAFIVWEFSKKRWGFTTFDRWCIICVFAGGLGNVIDRVRLGFVVDMIDLSFMDFPVFNVADCFITCGSIALVIHLLFFNKRFWKDEKV